MGAVSVYDNTSNIEAESTTRIDDGQWHHIAGTWSTATGAWVAKIYIDGSLEATATGSTDDAITYSTTTKLGMDNSSEYFLNGSIYEVAHWNVTLDGAAITSIYNSGNEINLLKDYLNYDNASALIGYWRFNEGTGTSLEDIKNNYDGTASNTTWGIGKSVNRLEVTSDILNVNENIALNDNYLSNDGGNEGIFITDAGNVTIDYTEF